MKIRLRGRLKQPEIADGCLEHLEFGEEAEAHSQQQLAEKLRNMLGEADCCLTEKFEAKEDVNQLVKARAWVVDQLILRAWNALIPADEKVSLIAVGGFGRGELHPHSDVDLLILLEDDVPGDRLRTAIENFVTLLWDAGFYLAHQVSANVGSFGEDAPTQTGKDRNQR